jgi:SAM-dependent methyltransferase/GNAT superfamily N-acetyltransferase
VEVTFEWYVGREVPEQLLQECSDLFGGHYGVWSEAAVERAGKRVRFSLDLVRKLLAGQDARLAIARSEGALLGYAASVQPTLPLVGTMSWVTQLVVHADYRKRGIARRLLFSIWAFSNHFAWGLVTSSPFTVRALEKATRRRVDPERIQAGIRTLLSGGTQVPYVKPSSETICDATTARINTDFLVDHSGLPEMIERVSSGSAWSLGELPEGWEWIAFTFRDQPQIALTPAEAQEMLEVADASTSVAYARMTMDDGHAWHKHTDREADFIWDNCKLRDGSRVLDIGCGDGRHLLALGPRGVSGVGLDSGEARLMSANEQAAAEKLDIRFIAGDAREATLDEEFDSVLCLYDVVGSYSENQENARILNTIAKQLKNGGTALISVMNLELTKALSPAEFSAHREPDKLLELPASRIMETSGNVFDPHHLLLDPETNVVYRREQFAAGGALPAEILVRDRRFSRDEIEGMCRAAGLEVVWSRFVQAGRWEAELGATEPGAKEILLLCTRS